MSPNTPAAQRVASQSPNGATASVLLSGERSRKALEAAYHQVRQHSEALIAPLNPEDMVVQTMADVSPTKWHLAHTSWFFQTFVLDQYQCDYDKPDEAFAYLFNSYYEQVGQQFPRPHRGWISRPTLDEVLHYRRAVDEGIGNFIAQADDDVWPRVAQLLVMGMHHEKQHQELMLTDIKHVLAQNPMFPAAYRAPERSPRANGRPSGADSFVPIAEQLTTVGWEAQDGFCFDCETPAHKLYMHAFALAEGLVSNGDYLEFVEADGYERPELWPSDGWALVRSEAWRQPLYWRRDGAGGWQEFTLHGLLPLDRAAPVCHLSWYEAQAYATFKGARLPTEAELEKAAVQAPDSERRAGCYHPHCTQIDDGQCSQQAWLWTSSAFLPYPGFKKVDGAIGEYNGKFMSGQMVLRGGSCLTPDHHMRPTYRNFFPPPARWQMTGLRLAKTLG